MEKWFFFVEFSLPRDHSIGFETSAKTSKVISSSTSELISLNNSNRNNCNRNNSNRNSSNRNNSNRNNCNRSPKEPSSSSSQRDSLNAKVSPYGNQIPVTRQTYFRSPKYQFNSKNKFDSLNFVIDNKTDIFLILETKLDDSFPTTQFLIEGFGTPYRHDRNSKGGYSSCISEKIHHPSVFHVRLTMTLKPW